MLKKIALLTLVCAFSSLAQRLQTDPISKGSRVIIAVAQSPDFSQVAVVTDNGTITIPLIGAVKAEGLTVAELSKDLEKRLSAFIKEPKVTVQWPQ